MTGITINNMKSPYKFIDSYTKDDRKTFIYFYSILIETFYYFLKI